MRLMAVTDVDGWAKVSLLSPLFSGGEIVKLRI
jgi:hypothetical protein